MSKQMQPDHAALRTAGRQKLRDTAPLARPFTIYIEPMNVCNLSCDLPTFLKLAKARDVADRIIVTTNATYHNEDMVRRTVASGLDDLRVNLVDADLRVTVGCVDWEKATTFGSLRDQSLAEIWRGQPRREFQLTHPPGDPGVFLDRMAI